MFKLEKLIVWQRGSRSKPDVVLGFCDTQAGCHQVGSSNPSHRHPYATLPCCALVPFTQTQGHQQHVQTRTWSGRASQSVGQDSQATLQKLDPDTLVPPVHPGWSRGRWLQTSQEPSGVGQRFGADHWELLLPFLQLLVEKQKVKRNQFGVYLFTMSTYKRLTTDLLPHLWQPAYMLASKRCYLKDTLQ